MKTHTLLQYIALSAVLTLSGCSNNDDEANQNSQSEFNENAPDPVNTGAPGGDISTIAGLWDGTTTTDETSDVVYWNLSTNGILTRYDYQQDGVTGATGENCYIIGDPISVFPEDDNAYSIFNVAVTAVRSDDALTITFLDADKNDVDEDGDTTETPTLNWTVLANPGLEDLNGCTSTGTNLQSTPVASEDENTITTDPTTDDEPVAGIGLPPAPPADLGGLSRVQCGDLGGTVVGDIGNGAIFEPEYRCPSGLKPIGSVYALEGEPVATEGEVCCR